MTCPRSPPNKKEGKQKVIRQGSTARWFAGDFNAVLAAFLAFPQIGRAQKNQKNFFSFDLQSYADKLCR